MSAKPNLQPTLQVLMDRDRRGLHEHPAPEALVAYHAGELPAAEQDSLRDHLALCHDCADLLLDLVSFAEFTPPEQTPALADGEVESAWQKFQPRLVRAEHAAVAQLAEWRREDGGGAGFVRRRSLVQAYAIAASLFVCVLGLSAWGVSLKRQIRASTVPKSVPFMDLFVDKERGASSVETVPSGSDRFFLFLHPPVGSSEFSTFAAEIRSLGSGAPIAHFDELLQNQGIELFRDQFPPGTYQVDFWGVEGDRKVPFDPLVFRIPALK
jgi:hypothetical protein